MLLTDGEIKEMMGEEIVIEGTQYLGENSPVRIIETVQQ